MGKVKVTIRFVHTVRGARDGNPSAVRAIPYKRDESEAIMGNDDRRGTASFGIVSRGKIRYNSIAAGTGVSVMKLFYKRLLPSGILRRTNICDRKIPDRRTNEKEGCKP